tara:strand:- start:417 stop:1061 length:645 start_codon:yes stop_codon:yes gene_type:complete
MVIKILTDYQRSKDDNGDDSLFYSEPRFVYHLDSEFRSRLSELYEKYIPSNAIVLDLMSSWVSHLPDRISYKKVIGHGMNLEELRRNKILDSYWVQDLNKDQKLPLDDSSVDICLMAAAWQYLQYPENVAAELQRVVVQGGLLIVSFSNRAFWNKAPSIWKQSSDSQRISYIRSILISTGWCDFEVVCEPSTKNSFIPFLGMPNDPFFSIIATN